MAAPTGPCFGDWVPPADLNAWIEHSHRLTAAVFVGPLVGAVALITVFTSRRRDVPMLVAAVLAGVLVIVQSLIGAAVVLQGLAAELVTVHLAMALTVFGDDPDRRTRDERAMPARHRPGAHPPGGRDRPRSSRRCSSARTGHHAGLAFGDFPLMNGALLPELVATQQAIQFAHRSMSVLVAILVVWTAISVHRTTDAPLPRRLVDLMVAGVAIQILIGGLNVIWRLSAFSVVPHPALGAALWGLSVWLVLGVRRLRPAEVRRPARSAESRGPVDTARAYIALTKPRIIELLLVTTLPTMALAKGGAVAVADGGGRRGDLAAGARTRSTWSSTATSTTSCAARGIGRCRAMPSNREARCLRHRPQRRCLRLADGHRRTCSARSSR